MTPRPSVSRLLVSNIGRLASNFIAMRETSLPRAGSTNKDIERRVRILIKIIEAVSPDKRRAGVGSLIQVAKSLRADISAELLVGIAKCDPELLIKMSEDDVVGRRIQHAYRVAEIAAVLSHENLISVRGGINEVLRRIFEAAHSGGERK